MSLAVHLRLFVATAAAGHAHVGKKFQHLAASVGSVLCGGVGGQGKPRSAHD